MGFLTIGIVYLHIQIFKLMYIRGSMNAEYIIKDDKVQFKFYGN
jgi:hypothetical protein